MDVSAGGLPAGAVQLLAVRKLNEFLGTSYSIEDALVLLEEHDTLFDVVDVLSRFYGG